MQYSTKHIYARPPPSQEVLGGVPFITGDAGYQVSERAVLHKVVEDMLSSCPAINSCRPPAHTEGGGDGPDSSTACSALLARVAVLMCNSAASNSEWCDGFASPMCPVVNKD